MLFGNNANVDDNEVTQESNGDFSNNDATADGLNTNDRQLKKKKAFVVDRYRSSIHIACLGC